MMFGHHNNYKNSKAKKKTVRRKTENRTMFYQRIIKKVLVRFCVFFCFRKSLTKLSAAYRLMFEE